jgi:Putative heavy-metal-binding
LAAPQPEATAGAPFDSGLSIPDFVACLSMGLEPLGLVQGFYCGQVSGWTNYSSRPVINYSCQHYENHLNPGWVGVVYGVDQIWTQAFNTALSRLMEEAAGLGAHGVVGLSMELSHPTNAQSCEVHLYGTAVRAPSAEAPRRRWCTRLAGHKLAKLVEIGFVPETVAYTRCTAVLVEGCATEYYNTQMGAYSGETVVPERDLHETARSFAVDEARRLAEHTSMYDVTMRVDEAEHMGSSFLTCTLTGSLVRRVRSTLPLASPLPTVRLS